MAEPTKVLVIEDDAGTRSVIEKVITREHTLRYLKLQVIQAADGEEGLQLYHEHRPGLVITDLLMPKVDGFKVIETIRGEPGGADLPILAITGVYLRDRKAMSRLDGELKVAVLPKPFSVPLLASRVNNLLRASQGGDPSRASEAPEPLAASSAAGAAVRPLGRLKLEKQPRPAAESLAAASPAAASPAAVSPAPPPTTQGSLVDRPPGRLLLEIFEAQLSGTLELRRAMVRKLIHVQDGHPIFVQSNQRSETLGQMLVKRGLLTPEEHARALDLSTSEGIKYGEALVKLGHMTEGEVMAELVAQTRVKIESCLGWRTGSFSFTEDPGIGAKVPRCRQDPVCLVLEGLKQRPDLEEAFTRLASKGSHVVRLDPRLDAYRECFVTVYGGALLQALVPGRSVAQVLEVVSSPQEAVLGLDVLLHIGVVGLVEQPHVAPAPLIEPASLSLETLTFDPGSSFPEAPPVDEWEEDSAVIRMPLAGPSVSAAAPRPVASSDPQELQIALQLIQSTYLGLHDASHYQVLGVMPQSDRSSIEVAYQIKRKQFDQRHFQEMELGEHQAHLDEICAALDQAWEVLGEPARRAAYDQTLSAPVPSTGRDDALGAEAHCREGEAHFEQERYAEAAESFARAIALDGQAEYRVFHALASFLAAGETPQAAEEAMVEVQMALAIDPGEVSAHLVAAKISRALGHSDEARQHLQQTIKLDPGCREAFDELEGLLREQADLDALELEYRRTIHLLGGREPELVKELWRRLVHLYRDDLTDPERTRVACEAALRADPRSQELQAVLAELNGENPERWPEAVLGYRSLLLSAPDDPGPLHQLFRLHQDAGRGDAAYLAASAAEARGAVSMEERAVTAVRDVELRLIDGPLAPSLWESLRHPEDDPALATLFRLLAPVVQRLDPLHLADLGVEPEDLQEEEDLPDRFLSLLRYVSLAQGVELPRVALKPDLDHDVQAAGCDPPILLVGASALFLEDRFELAFRLTRAVNLLSPGRVMAMWRRRRVLRNYILASLGLAFPRLEVPDEGGLIARIRAAIESAPDLQVAVVGTVTALRQRFQQLNLGSWQRGIQLTADRVGLLLCTDLPTACRILAAGDVADERELLDFALSETYGELRASLGLAVD